ncbi:MAG: sigma-54-dependent Fis family transcriptional regulator [Gemmatimonadaceae bacterium]|nr:sigma-54-dependent Fis family transcriptional regulator [Gemmatimonadaceae bacterium]
MNETKIKVLVAEDEVHLGQILSYFLTGRGYAVHTVTDGRAALDALRAESFDVALLDIVMPELDGLEVLKQVRADADPPEVIIITGNGTIETAISAMKLGAYDYMAKPYRMAEIDVLVRRAWEKRRLARENVLLHTQLDKVGGATEIVTQYAPLQAVLDVVARVAPSDSPVLVTGESGTGKELIAQTLHRLSKRDGPFVDVSCAALSEGMLESELFGHERSAFPGADERKLGLMELAAGGTLFLDEISELSPKLQGKLLRALEQRSFYRVGGTQKVEVDVRILAATNSDLSQRVSEGNFRDDLFYRVNTIAIELPPLRDRAVDIPLLARQFLRQYGKSNPPTLTVDALDLLTRYAWPGNVRELRNVIERVVLLAQGPQIRASDLPLPTSNHGMTPASTPAISLAELERRHIETVLHNTNWHQGRAASALGISSKTLYRKIKEYGFHRPGGID